MPSVYAERRLRCRIIHSSTSHFPLWIQRQIQPSAFTGHDSPHPLFLNPDLSTRLPILSRPILRFIIPTATIVHLSNPRTIEDFFPQAFIDLVVHRTSPHLGHFSPTDLRWVLLQYLLEMRGALAAGV